MLGAFQGYICAAQTAAQKPDYNEPLRCLISVEKNQWRPEDRAVVNITIESVVARPVVVPLWSELYLSPRSKNDVEMGRRTRPGRIMAEIESAALLPALRDPASHLSWDGITSGCLRVNLAHKADQTRISIDARNLIWDFRK